MTEWLVESVKGMPAFLQIIVLAAIPVTELRASIPIGAAMGMPLIDAFFFSLIGNSIPAFVLPPLLEPVFNIMARIPFLEKLLARLLERTREKGDQVKKYGPVGLMIFVAIPAPGTGVWTGALLSFLFGLPYRKTLPALVAGAAIAGVLVSLATAGVLTAIRGGYGIAAGVLLIGLVFFYVFRQKGEKKD